MSVDLLKKPVLAVFVSVFTLLAALLAAPAPQAQAAERNLVAFGDSVLADPDMGTYLRDRIGGAFDQRPLGVNCPKGNNYAVRTGAKLGLPVRDFSCSGAASMSPGPQISAQIDTAIARGALNPSTARVIYATGFNDTYNNANLNQAQIRAKFVRFNRPLIDRIRAAAPNARIQIVGYPTIGDGIHYCLIHAGSSWDRTPLPQVADFENKAQWMQVDLARATGTEFVDLKPSTRNSGMCGPDGNRKWAGLVDFNAGDGNLPLHVNARGHEHIANVLAAS
ncbi:GDSL-type esterase/lipase family protein [Corynebacterium confusum]|uniref:GDSL-type esterase/lipase family protein n=1 Tax=Corynebacterium confusum TaxID=71254 RepID=UPI0025B4647B|nr:GDSL-type esterase/lipase family protein [Corynebacterium confusum]WJY88798.1 hypothetical protein CCONF_01175 [Corynebacterium confusum]